MKTAIGYAFLAFAAFMATVFMIVIYYSIRGKIHIIDPAYHGPLYLTGTIILGLANLIAIFPLTYYGFKWIKKELPYASPPTGSDRVQ
jgi:hypothetical protein